MDKINRKFLFTGVIIILLLGIIMAFEQKRAESSAMPAARKIMFTGGKWKSILTLAKKNHKYIFVDAYTNWCGPCRELKNVSFKDKEAAAYYNRNFINYTIDMEKGEGIGLAEEWDVTAYPTLLFFTPDGKTVMKQIGYVDGKRLVEFGNQALSIK